MWVYSSAFSHGTPTYLAGYFHKMYKNLIIFEFIYLFVLK